MNRHISQHTIPYSCTRDMDSTNQIFGPNSNLLYGLIMYILQKGCCVTTIDSDDDLFDYDFYVCSCIKAVLKGQVRITSAHVI